MIWKRLEHKTIVPLLGITTAPPQLISEWMPSGELTKYIGKHPDANRLDLVSIPPLGSGPILTPAPSYVMSLRAFTIFTLVT